MEEVKSTLIPHPTTYVLCRICGKSGRREVGAPEICEHRARNEGLLVNDVVEIRYNTVTCLREVSFPTLSVCGTGCGGYSGVSGLYRDWPLGLPRDAHWIKDGVLALQVALVQHGYTVIKHWDNLAPYHACDCAARLTVLKEAFGKLPLATDSGWLMQDSSHPTRGIRDYSRTVTFTRSLTDHEQEMLQELVGRTKPGQYLNIRRTLAPQGAGVRYDYHSTLDSSD